MRFLIDTGILLRLIDTELWNVATRPQANNGLNLPPATVSQLFQQAIEPFCTIVTEPMSLPAEFRRLLLQYSVVGKQVHDARLVAMMLAVQVENILTLNEQDFRRYEPEGITVFTPATVIASKP
jgi:hypothetical protein